MDLGNGEYIRKILDRIESQLEDMRVLAARGAGTLLAVCEELSAWSSSEHLDHSLKVCSAVLKEILERRQPLPRGITPLGRVVLFLGRFPRGRGESPEHLRGTRVSGEQIVAAIREVHLRIDQVREATFRAAEGPLIRHPVFGGLTALQALRFLDVHNRHHLRIIAGIVATTRREDG